jgi:hypothetical protein
MKLYRIIIDISLLFLIFILPPYISFVFLIIFIFVLNNFVESIFGSFILDSLYGAKSITMYDSSFLNMFYSHRFLIIILIIFLISFNLKKVLKFYPKDKR